MNDLIAANRYAQALFELVEEAGQEEEMEKEIISFSEALKASPELLKFFLSPQYKIAEKRSFLERIYQHGVSQKVLLDFLTILLEKNRFHLIHDIVTEFRKIEDLAQGQAVAEIRSAAPLDAKTEAAIVARIERMAGYRIRVKKEVDPSLIGGVVVKVRNKVLDGSVKHHLNRIKEELLNVKTA